MEDYIFKKESFAIIGRCMNVHNVLGPGFSEIVYKDALEYEFKVSNIPFEREKEYLINYKDIVLPHKYYADFVVYNEIILEIKGYAEMKKDFISQTINYLKASRNRLGLLINFGSKELYYKRIVI